MQPDLYRDLYRDPHRDLYRDRRHAGRVLARHLAAFAGRPGITVFALPRGGVPVGYEVARALQATLDIYVVRKLGVPGMMECAMGALAQNGDVTLDDAVLNAMSISPAAFDEVLRAERSELERRVRRYRDDRPLPDLRGRDAIVVDDGLATGSTMEVAVRAIRALQPERIVVAVPVGSDDACARLAAVADEVICASRPARFRSVGEAYEDFEQIDDNEVRDLMVLARRVCGSRDAA